jgi:hypothetical protein
MKTVRTLITAAVLAAAATSAAADTGYRAIGPDGIAASPRHRERLNELGGPRYVTSADSIVVVVPAQPAIAASPRFREQWHDRRYLSAQGGAEPDVVYRDSSRIYASPRFREHMEFSRPRVGVAP